LPLAAHPDPHTAAVIGFGSGLSTHTLLGDQRLERVDTVEIEPAMYEGAKVFCPRVARAYTDPRSHVVFDDAKAYFAANQSRYDIIVSEPSNPWVSGVASLFSVEFYRFIPRHLNPGGVFVQWMHLYEINDELVAAVGRSLATVFVDFRVYLSNSDDMVIVAKADGPLGVIDDDALFRQADLRSALERVGLKSAEDLAMHQLGDKQSILPLFNALSTRTNSDFMPIVSLEAPRTRFAQRNAAVIEGLSTADLPMREVLAGLRLVDPANVTENPYFTPSAFAHQAVIIAAALRSKSIDCANSDMGIASAVTYLLASVGHCQGSADGTLETDTLIRFAGRTIPFLNAAQLDGVWVTPRWIECDTQPEMVRKMLHFLDSLARRDFGQTRVQAEALLKEHSKQLSPTARDWLLRAAMLAAIAVEDYDGVSDIDSRLGKDVSGGETSILQRAYLIAFADARRGHDK
jgi:hypothetical protein